MKLLKKSQPQQETPPAFQPKGSLPDRIRAAVAEAEAFVESKVQELKASPEGATLPIDWLRHNIYATARARGCHCRCALALIDQEKK